MPKRQRTPSSPISLSSTDNMDAEGSPSTNQVYESTDMCKKQRHGTTPSSPISLSSTEDLDAEASSNQDKVTLLRQEKAKVEDEVRILKGNMFRSDIEAKMLGNEVENLGALLKYKTKKVKLLEKEKNDLEELVGRQEQSIADLEALRREVDRGWKQLLLVNSAEGIS